MKKEFIKQVIIGVAGVLVTAGLFAVCYILWHSYVSQFVIDAILAVFAACFFGSLFYTFGGKQGFIYGAIMGAAIVAFKVAAVVLPGWVFGCIAFAAIIIFVVRPLIKQYRKDIKKSGGKASSKKITEEIILEESAEEEIRGEDNEFSKSVGLGEKSLLLLAGTGGMYQLIKASGRFYFVRIGGQLSGMDQSLIRTDFSDESAFTAGKKDFIISPNDITNIKLKYHKVKSIPFENCCEIWIYTDHKKYHFAVLEKLPLKKIESYFAGLPIAVKSKKAASAPAYRLTGEEKKALPILKKVCLGLMIASFVFGPALLFFPVDPVLYRIFSVACILIPIITLVLYIKYNHILSLEDTGRGEAKFNKTHINMGLPLFIPSVALLLRTLYDITVTGWQNLLIWSGAAIAVTLLLFFGFTKEYRHKKSVIFVIVFVMLFYIPCSILQINCLFDYSKPVVYSTPMVDKHVSTSSKGGTRYYITVDLQNGNEQEISVGKEYFNSHDKGKNVTVVEKPGLLGISNVYADEDE